MITYLLKLYSKLSKRTLLIKVKNKSYYVQPNGSCIISFPTTQDNIRGNRTKYFNPIDDYCNLTKEELDDILKPYQTKGQCK